MMIRGGKVNRLNKLISPDNLTSEFLEKFIKDKKNLIFFTNYL